MKKAACKACFKEILIAKRASARNSLCESCRKIRGDYRTRNKCIVCGSNYELSKKSYCDACRLRIYQDNGRRNSAKQSQAKRSWSEVELGKLCEARFNKITFNDPIFPNDPPTTSHWDADILIHDHKIAVLWNGPWHYRKLRNKHNLEQVQSRDQIKMKCIVAFGWMPIVIKDEEGKKSLSKVKEAFETILEKI